MRNTLMPRRVVHAIIVAATVVGLVAPVSVAANPVPRPPSLLEGTTSPSKRYGAAWDLPGKRLDWARLTDTANNDAYFNSLNLDYNNAANYLIRLKDGKALGKINGAHHWQTGANSLNHSDLTLCWSPDEKAAVAWWDGKWFYNEITLLRLSSTGVIAHQKRMGAQIERDARRAAGRRFPAAYRQFARGYDKSFPENLKNRAFPTAEVSHVRLPNAASLTLDADLYIPKKEGASFTVHLTYRLEPDATAHLVRTAVVKHFD